MKEHAYFDRRAATYDRDAVHHRVVSLLLEGVDIGAGSCILDIATGTGILALEAARKAGPGGKVIGVDVSQGMLYSPRQHTVTQPPYEPPAPPPSVRQRMKADHSDLA